MTTPRSPKSPARKKARVWKAWAVESANPGHPVHLTVTSPFNGERVTVLVLFKTRADARLYFDGTSGEVPATIHPVPPRSRKGGIRG